MSPNVDDILEAILVREGSGTPPYLAKNDAGGRTSWGISEKAHPEMWKPGPPTRAQAKALLFAQYVTPFVPLGNPQLIAAISDDAVMQGYSDAVKRLQHVVGVPMDGVMGSVTFNAVRMQSANKLLQKYVIERAVRITRLVERRPTDLTNLTGWITRILGFLPEATL